MIVARHLSPARYCPVTGLQGDLRDTWRELAAGNPLEDPAWVLAAWNHVHCREPGTDELSWAGMSVVDSCGRLAAVVPWFVQRRYGLSILRLAGSGSICSDYARPVVAPSMAGRVGEELAAALAEGGVSASGGMRRVDWIEVDGHVADDPSWLAMFNRLKQAGWLEVCTPIEGTWRAGLPGTWNEFESRLHKSRRRKARRAARMLEDGSVSGQVFRSAVDIRSCWPDFVRLHQLRREQLGQKGCFAVPGFGQFLLDAVEGLAARQQTWIAQVSVEGRALAMLLMLDSGPVSLMYQSGLDTTRLDLEPGHLVNTFAIREAIRQGQRGFDWLRGDEPYKAGWLAQRVPLFRTRLFAPRWRGRAAWVAGCAIRALRDSIGRWRSPRTADCLADSSREMGELEGKRSGHPAPPVDHSGART